MNNNKPLYWFINNISLYNKDKIKNSFEKYGQCQIHYFPEKNNCYVSYENHNIIKDIITNKKDIIKKELGEDLIFKRVDKTPLDLNPPSKILLIIFFRINEEIDININYMKELFKDCDKLVLFKRKNTIQSLIKFSDINISKKYKEILPSKFLDLDIKVKVCYTDKTDIIINTKNKNEIDFAKGDLNVQDNEEEDTKTNKFILKNKKKNSLIHSLNTNKVKDKIGKIYGNINCGCLYLKSKSKLRFTEIFNLFSLFGYLKSIEISSSQKRMVLMFKNNKEFINVFDKLKNIVNSFKKFSIILPNYLENEIHESYLDGKNNLKDLYFKFLKKNNHTTVKQSSFNKFVENKINYKVKHFNSNDQRKLILKNKIKDFKISNILWIKNLPSNTSMIKLNKFFRKKYNNIIPLISLIKPFKNYYILICESVEISINLLMKFHNIKYNNKKWKIYFACNKLLNHFQKHFSDKNIFEVKEGNLFTEQQLKSLNEKKDRIISEKIIEKKKNLTNINSLNFNNNIY